MNCHCHESFLFLKVLSFCGPITCYLTALEILIPPSRLHCRHCPWSIHPPLVGEGRESVNSPLATTASKTGLGIRKSFLLKKSSGFSTLITYNSSPHPLQRTTGFHIALRCHFNPRSWWSQGDFSMEMSSFFRVRFGPCFSRFLFLSG